MKVKMPSIRRTTTLKKSIPGKAASKSSNYSYTALFERSGYCIAFLCLLQGFEQTKYYTLNFTDKQDIESYLKFMLHVAYTLSKIFFLRFVTSRKKPKRIYESRASLSKLYNESAEEAIKMDGGEGFLRLLSFGLAFAMTAFEVYALSDWSLEKFIFTQSAALKHTILVWSGQNVTSSRSMYLINEEIQSSGGWNFISLPLSFFGAAMNYFGYLQDTGIRDRVLMTTITVRKEVKRFIRRYGSVTVEDIEKMPEESRKKQWRGFGALKEFCNSVNEGLAGLFKVVHASNVLIVVNFILRRLMGVPFDIQDAMSMINILKAGIFYWAAVDTAKYHEFVDEWVGSWASKIDSAEVNGVILDIEDIQDELHNFPVGIGEKGFYVDEIFVFKMIGTIAVIFLVIAASKSPKECMISVD